ncbi:response regulator transcription factor [Fontivita pretiosa]|uniref:response regulator transcription factor n=1 Tax=Fontivita pretiosa TaxID=2989684 RepID=UPI003D1869D9
MNPSTSAAGSVEASAGVAPRRRSVLLVDDHPIVRQGLAQLINQEPDLLVSAEVATARQALDLLDRPGAAPDIAIVDISLEDRSGIELIKEIRARWPLLPILVLSMHDEALYAERALRAGARGYIMKQEATDRVMTAIRKVLGGEIYVGERIAARLLGQLVNAGSGENVSSLRRLSDRELEIFTMIGRGMGTREIASKLFLSVKTVEAHREHIKEKLQLRSGTELMRAAVQYVLELPRSQ